MSLTDPYIRGELTIGLKAFTTLLANDAVSRILTLCERLPLLRDLPVMFIDSEGLKYYAKVQDWWRFAKPFEPPTSKFLIKS